MSDIEVFSIQAWKAMCFDYHSHQSYDKFKNLWDSIVFNLPARSGFLHLT